MRNDAPVRVRIDASTCIITTVHGRRKEDQEQLEGFGVQLRKALPGAALVVFCLFTLPAHAIFIYTNPAAGLSGAKHSWASRASATETGKSTTRAASSFAAAADSAPLFTRFEARPEWLLFFWADSVRGRLNNWRAATDRAIRNTQPASMPTASPSQPVVAVSAPALFDAPILEIPTPQLSGPATIVADATLTPNGGGGVSGLVQEVVEAGAKLPDVELVSPSMMASVPEPGTTGLFLAGLAILLAGSWCRRARPLELGRRHKLRR